MMEETTKTAGSPESLPSLSQVSTNSTEDEESLKLACELPARNSRPTFRYHTMFDIEEEEEEEEEEDTISLSSGILSITAMDLPADQHSVASMETIKLQNSKESKSPDETLPMYESVEAEDIPASRVCHGALNITPKQLGEVFALFTSDHKPRQSWPPSTTMASKEEKHQPSGSPSNATVVSASTIPVAPTQPMPMNALPKDRPMSIDERDNMNMANHQRSSGELFWKPKAKSLEKECTALKEIIRVDSSNIVKLKAALEMRKKCTSNYLKQVKNLKAQLASAIYDISVLKRQREMLLEHETEHLETIRILKHEVDRLTSEDDNSSKKSGDEENKEEIRQLRLENQLFASQIVEYEEELSCVLLMEKEQEQLKQRVETMQRRMNNHASDSDLCYHDYESFMGESEEVSAQEDLQDRPQFSFYDPEQRPSSQKTFLAPVPSLLDKEPLDRSDAVKQSEERRKQLMEQLLSSDESESNEESKESENGSGTNGEEARSEKLSSDASSQASMLILRDRVLGMFTVNTTSEDGKQQEKNEIYVIHDQEDPYSTETENEVKCLQWHNPESRPSYVKMENIAMSVSEPEDRNPPASHPMEDPASSPKSRRRALSVRNVMERHPVSDVERSTRDDTLIEVLQTGDASEAIEVQLSPKRSVDDDNKENEGGHKPYLCSTGCDDTCDAWSALGCPFFSSDNKPAQQKQ